jgi:hypothetical protein
MAQHRLQAAAPVGGRAQGGLDLLTETQRDAGLAERLQIGPPHQSLGDLPPAEFEALHAPRFEMSTPTIKI